MVQGFVAPEWIAWFPAYYSPNTSVPDTVTNGTAFIAAVSNNAGGVNALLGDGSVHFIEPSIDLPAWQALGPRDIGEVAKADWTN